MLLPLSLLLWASYFVQTSLSLNMRLSVGDGCANYGIYACATEGSILICNYASVQTLVWQLSNTCDAGTFCGFLNGLPYCLPTVRTIPAPTTSALIINESPTPPLPIPPSPPPPPFPATVTTLQNPPPQTSESNPSNPSDTIPSLPKIKKAVYIDASTNSAQTDLSLSVPTPTTTNPYNVIILAFWLSSAGAWDAAYTWTHLPPETRTSYIEAYHRSGKLVLVSAFGSTENPTTEGKDPVQTATRLAEFVKESGFDGVDVDWEDNAAMEAGSGEAWLVTFTRVLREALPRPRYVISHAPQAPYFVDDRGRYKGGGYLTVDREVGELIDWYNVQFYNQGSTRYDTCQTLFYESGGWFQGTSVFEIVGKGVDVGKVVVGKPITTAGVMNTGFMEAWDLAQCFSKAKEMGWNAGVMGWQYSLDPSFNWIKTLSDALE
ncbi:hypothetical protein HDU79_008007 [Rhizoclosmatium sp. JEL0117]|nr:hypothetical protein HDU79_008007 [Rhizoclosmatium sp. JEL0117]